MQSPLLPTCSRKSYGESSRATRAGSGLNVPEGETYRVGRGFHVRQARRRTSRTCRCSPRRCTISIGARVLAVLGDSVTTDHISPAGSIKANSPAGKYLIEHGVQPADFNSYGSRRGNHEVMVRGTFANVRLRNKLAPDRKAAFTRHLPDGEEMSIFDASVKYMAEGVPLVILAGKEYGSGSSRDWAAKGPRLLGVRAVIAESYERIHRSNLVGMGILPLQFLAGENARVTGPYGRRSVRDCGLTAMLVRKFAAGQAGESARRRRTAR